MADSREMLKIACAALEDKKAFDIKIIDISRISTLCDYIVIADGTNKKQVQALSDNVEDSMHEAGYSHKGVEGYSEGGWILLDYYDIIIHIFLKNQEDSIISKRYGATETRYLRTVYKT